MDQGHASADNLTALKAGLLRGRLLTDAEDGATPLVVIINQALARRYFPNQDPDRANAVSQQTWEIGVAHGVGGTAPFGVQAGNAAGGTVAGSRAGDRAGLLGGASLLVRNLLFGVRAWGTVTLGCLALLLGLTSTAAAFLPRRAASVNPTDALRAE